MKDITSSPTRTGRTTTSIEISTGSASPGGDNRSIVFPAIEGFNGYAFLPDFTEHPKPPKRKLHYPHHEPNRPPPSFATDDEEGDVSFIHDFIAGGAAGSASVIVGHPFDTLKVRLQTSNGTTAQMLRNLSEYGGVTSLYRGMGAPLSAATAINAVVFTSYGIASRFYDEYIYPPESFLDHYADHDPWQKSMLCGMFAGSTQNLIIAPMEHVKCRLQIQHGKGSADAKYKGSLDATLSIVREHGIRRLFQGFWATFWREVPCFGLYFASYDYIKDKANDFLAKQAGIETKDGQPTGQHSHTWVASAFAGGSAGCITWSMAYPIDVIKSRIQTAPLSTPQSDLKLFKVGSDILRQHGIGYLYRGVGVTLVRAFPVNGTIFPVYEYTLIQVKSWTDNK